MKRRKLIVILMLACSVAVLVSGCGSLKKEPEAEIVIETEEPTEAETDLITEKATEPQTEKQTEVQTEAPVQTEPERRRDLTVDEELAEETSYDAPRTVYASDDINVRELPGTDGEVFASFYQGDSIAVIGETPNWYVVTIEDYESNGYVSKDFVSAGEVDAKTEEERAAAAEAEAEAAVGASDISPENAVNSSVDEEYGVGAYAEPFEIEAVAGANVRLTPSPDGEIVNTVSTGTYVKVLGYTDRWYKIEYEGAIGYVNQNLFASE